MTGATREAGFDVIVPAFNPGELLDRAIASVLAVGGVERVVLVDDGSEVPIEAGVRARFGDRVDVVRTPNGGPSAARNIGIDRVLSEGRAERVVLLDADDELLVGVREAIAMDADLVVSAREERRGAGASRVRGLPDWVMPGVDLHPGLAHRPSAVWGASGMVVSRRVLEAGARFPTDVRIGEDVWFVREVGERGTVRASATPALRVTLHEGGDNLTSSKHFVRRAADLLRIYDRWYDVGDDAGWRESFRWLVNQMVKSRVAKRELSALLAVWRARGWSMPMKLRLRLLLAR